MSEQGSPSCGDILLEVGLAEDRIRELHAQGVIGGEQDITLNAVSVAAE